MGFLEADHSHGAGRDLALTPLRVERVGEKAQLVVQTCLEPKWPRPSLSHLGHPHSTIAQDVDIPVLHNGTDKKKLVELASF